MQTLFPPRLIQNPPAGIAPGLVRAALPYRHRSGANWGEKLRVIKDYGGAKGGTFTSREDVQLLGLDFVADVLTAQIADLPSAAVCPVPARPASEKHPGAVSLRLGELVASQSRRRFDPVLQRHGDEYLIEPTADPAGRTYVVVDDQYTRGDSMAKAIESLRAAGAEVVGAAVFTAGSTGAATDLHPPFVEGACGMAAAGQVLGIECVCGRDDPDEDALPF